MDTLYIYQKQVTLSIRQGRLLINTPEQSQSVALKRLKQIVICQPVDINTSLLHGLVKADIHVHLYHAHTQVTSVSVTPEPTAHVLRRQGQYLAMSHAADNLRLVRILILYKLHRQRHWLKTMGADSHASRVSVLTDRLKASRPLRYEELLNCEALGAKQVYQAMTALVPSAFHFSGRNRRPPKDPVNAMLSLGAAFLYQLAHKALSEKGMDAYAGFLHKPSAGRASLACDLVDCLRPDLEHFVMQRVLNKTIQVTHFDWQKGQHCELNRQGQAAWFHQWHPFSKAAEKRMRYISLKWATAAESYRVNRSGA
ncbi:CRISPR-associated endonuclease Cas1 [Endozoicomonas montiporae]|nr:CRISPR-associated endonuclease Cas1 [Endozoicomonas montiporae]AMO56210.1 CRISPR-associated Cas1 family protein [Endozoicomonas montiporae CL-33]